MDVLRRVLGRARRKPLQRRHSGGTVQLETKYVYLVHLDSEDGARKAGQPAAIRFVFELLAHQRPAKLSCEIDMRRPRLSGFRVVFNDFDSTGTTRQQQQPEA